jgi:arylamine N-acetyltransferase
MWVLETQDSHSKTWKNAYCFSEQEFLPQDFVTLNFRTMTDPKCWFTFILIMARVSLKDGGNGEKEAEGTLTLRGDTLNRRIGGGETEVVEKCGSEQERVAVLKRYFGVELNKEEIQGIVGTKTAITSS